MRYAREIIFVRGRNMLSYRSTMAHRSDDSSSLKTRLTYGAVVGAFLGMIIGTMPGNHPALGVIGMGLGAFLISGLSVVSNSFWESLLAAWELVRVAFWRW
jgi:hypothetical protein